MYYELICRTRPRARVHHHCDHCKRSIAPGEVYDRFAARWEGEFQCSKSHLDCQAMFVERLIEMGEDEGMFLAEDDWGTGELDSWRGLFPHVVTRLELTWDLALMRWNGRNA